MRQELRDRIEAEEALRHQDHHDALTGLVDRVQLRAALDAALVRGPAVRDLLTEPGIDLQQGRLHGRPATDDGEPP